jgi:outer membrane receptor for ferrienterochelin and colicins
VQIKKCLVALTVATSLSQAISQFILSETAQAQSSADNINLDQVNLSDLLDIQIESASKQAEPLSEAPVPMTVITADMIKNSGVRTLKDALILFVPGYTESQDRNETLFATRGIYATAQQKVLIAINGHRINSRSYLTAVPNFSIALHNIERIEILRGPGSSLYGNVALAGVVNLITKKGKDVNLNSVEYGTGNHGQNRLRMMTGAGGQDWDMLAWGQYYNAAGQIHKLEGSEPYNTGKSGEIRIGGANNRSSHDFGFTYKKDKWTFFGASRQGHDVEPYGANNPYNYDKYRTFQGTGPGLGLAHQHLGVKFDDSNASGWSYSVNPYFDRTEINGILANSTNGGNVITWQDQNIGFISQATKNYQSDWGSGSLLFGAQADVFDVTESAMFTITAGEFSGSADTNANRLLRLGGEGIYSLFVQDKHRFGTQWILSTGGRYDYKTRLKGEIQEKFSPRLALIHLPNETWEYKLSYSQSFVDGPYWYRYNQGLAAFGGSENLQPEILEAYQFQTVWKSSDKRMRNASTLYYQIGSSLVVNKATAAGTPADPKYINSGKIESAGLENEFQWNHNNYQLVWTLQYANAIATADFQRFDGKFAHVPQLTSTFVFNYLFSKTMTANLSVVHIGEQVYNKGTATAPSAATVDAATLVHIGGRVENIAGSGVYFDGRVFNALDTQNFQGGQSGTQIPFRQPGRWYLASLGAEF